ncbi:MAG TPA: aminopeptidase P family protein [Gemmatimonadales bacterium]|nr:aminopeptidase P family protein [Gemmatimonadales bacterium]
MSLRPLVLLLAFALPLAAQDGSPGGPIPVQLLQARRAAVLDSMPAGVLVIESGKIRSIEGDYPQDSDYRENSDFFYLTGLEAPGGTLVAVQPDSSRQGGYFILYLPAPPAQADRVSAARSYADARSAALSGLTDVRAKPARRRFRDPDPFIAVRDSIVAAHGDNSLNPRLVLGPLRQVKDTDEIRRLREASRITARAHVEAMRQARVGMWEYQIEALLEYNFRKEGAERVGYPSIVGSGFNSTILHYDLSRRRTEPGDLVLVDAAAEFGYYSADLTRTFPIDGRFTDRQRAIYDLVLGAQQAAIDSVRPGRTIAELNTIARNHIRDHSGDLCAPVTCDTFFIHGLSHWVGMEVHDVGPYFVPLEPGMVFTIEPGIYIPDESLGVRIEDVILVTESGYENLTRDAPRAAADIERLMAEGRGAGR